MDPDQTAPLGAVCSGSTLFASILNLSVMLGNYLQHTTSADDIFRCIFFLGASRVNSLSVELLQNFTQGSVTPAMVKSHKLHLVLKQTL